MSEQKPVEIPAALLEKMSLGLEELVKPLYPRMLIHTLGEVVVVDRAPGLARARWSPEEMARHHGVLMPEVVESLFVQVGDAMLADLLTAPTTVRVDRTLTRALDVFQIPEACEPGPYWALCGPRAFGAMYQGLVQSALYVREKGDPPPPLFTLGAVYGRLGGNPIRVVGCPMLKDDHVLVGGVYPPRGAKSSRLELSHLCHSRGEPCALYVEGRFRPGHAWLARLREPVDRGPQTE